MSSAEYLELNAVLHDALSRALLTQESAMVTRWVVLAETVDEDGERGLWTVAADDMKAWDTAGLLIHALHMEQAKTTVDKIGECE